MKRSLAFIAALISACATPPPRDIDPALKGAMATSGERRKPEAPALEQQLLPPLRMEMPRVAGEPIDQRFDLSVNSAPAAQVFQALVSGTRYSMLVHPSVTGAISVNLKDVTLVEALDSIRELYGYEYRIEGTRVFIQPAGIQARVFQVNYLSGQRRGLSQVRVSSNMDTTTSGTTTGTGTGIGGTTGVGGVGGIGGAASLASQSSVVGGAPSRDSTRVTTNQEAIFWTDLCEALVAIVFPPGRGQAAQQPVQPTTGVAGIGAIPGPDERQRQACNRRYEDPTGVRSIVVSPHSGVVVVRATPTELRAVDNYLRATRLAVERQVMLEAKIVEVTLAEQFQSGINWAAFGRAVAVGQLTRPLAAPRTSTLFESQGPTSQGQSTTTSTGVLDRTRDNLVNAAASQLVSGPAGAVVGLAVASSNFAALLTFLETQGNVQVLSSPRVATLNNQKAVLKVGQDQLFVSNVEVTPPTVTAVGTATTRPTIAPHFSTYFSGIVLDVTPQIDDRGNITLHIHPTINDVTTAQINIDLGESQNVNVPTARNTIRETDTIVRVSDGNIVAIGGLMRTEVNDVRGGIPGAPNSGPIGFLFRSTNRVVEKKELVILLKPTIIESDGDWEKDLVETRNRLDALGREMKEKGR
jgi:MSHA biogenesis protein MshL